MIQPGDDILLALGGGAARGVAHIGVIRTLEEAGYNIRGVAGTSIGAVIGGMYCAGKLDPFGDFIQTLDRRGVFRFLDPILPRAGLFAGARLEELLCGFVGECEISDLELPFVAVAVDLADGDELRLADGALVEAIRASFGIPGLFSPKGLVIDGKERWLVDGGVASPVPVGAAGDLGDLPIVAVNVNRGFEQPRVLRKRNGKNKRSRMDAFLTDERVPLAARDFLGSMLESRTDKNSKSAASEAESRWAILKWRGMFRTRDKNRSPGMIDSLYSSLLLLQHHLARSQFQATPPALLIEPNLEGVGLFDFHLSEALIEEGKRATLETLKLGQPS